MRKQRKPRKGTGFNHERQKARILTVKGAIRLRARLPSSQCYDATSRRDKPPPRALALPPTIWGTNGEDNKMVNLQYQAPKSDNCSIFIKCRAWRNSLSRAAITRTMFLFIWVIFIFIRAASHYCRPLTPAVPSGLMQFGIRSRSRHGGTGLFSEVPSEPNHVRPKN